MRRISSSFLALFVTMMSFLWACDCGPTLPEMDGGLDAETDADASQMDSSMGDGGCALGAACGSTCCTTGEFCSADLVCCPSEQACGNRCCGAGEVCEGAVCHVDCGDPELRCADALGNEVCCEEGQVCATGACFTPTTSCVDFIDCPNGQYCEHSVEGGHCLPQPGGEACQHTPSGSVFEPMALWHWPPRDMSGEPIAPAEVPDSVQVMMAPMVANLNDDNLDGVIDENDVPDVVFITFAGGQYSRHGRLRALNGADGSMLFTVTDDAYRVVPGGQVAIGDIDGDGSPDIVACSAADTENTGPLIAFNHDGTHKWTSTSEHVRCGQAAPAIADFDGDGNVEVFVRYSVVRGADGSYVGHELCDGIADLGETVREAHDPCDYATAANVDDEPDLELIGGNVVFKVDPVGGGLTPLWDHRFCDDSPNCRNDGYPAVADFDGDGEPELVVVESSWMNASTTPVGQSYQGDHWLVIRNARTGAVIAGPIDINRVEPPEGDLDPEDACQEIAGVEYCRIAGGGPPTIGNFDPTDAAPEIALAGAYNYVVFDVDLSQATPAARLSEIWHRRTNDNSSRKTGSSIFDFDGDGAAEVVYNDQDWLRVYDGATGETRYCRCNRSATLWEYPVIADVDNDGHAEIVVATNTYGDPARTTCEAVEGDQCTVDEIAAGRNQARAGITVLRGPGEGWIGTRRIWNQHTYHVTNVTESGRIPPVETRNWTIGALNNFRLNVQPGATNQPDLRPRNVSVDLSGCDTTMRVYAEIYNAGWSSAPAGVPVAFYGGTSPGSLTLIGSASTTRALLPGQHELVELDYPITNAQADYTFRVVVNDPMQSPIPELVECDDANNAAMTSARCLVIIID